MENEHLSPMGSSFQYLDNQNPWSTVKAMLNLTRDEIAWLLGPLIEHIEKLERMPPYPKQSEDLKPYKGSRRQTESRNPVADKPGYQSANRSEGAAQSTHSLYSPLQT